MAPARTTELASIIAADTKVIEEYLASNDMPPLSLDVNASPMPLQAAPPQVKAAQTSLAEATLELNRLARGPASSLSNMLGNAFDIFALSVIIRFGIADLIPLSGDISFKDISQKSGIAVIEVRRVLRLASLNFMFCETQAESVAHTALSRLLRSESPIYMLLQTMVSEIWPAAFHAAEALHKHPNADEPAQSGWAIANNASSPLFEELSHSDPARGKSFAKTMDWFASQTPTQPLVDSYPRASLGSATVVDVGGGHGPVSIAIAEQYPKLKFIVQDLGNTALEGPSYVPSHLSDRISFMEHNFFNEQPVKGADAYFFRATFHNWPDKYCVKILRALIPALKHNARIILNEPWLPEPHQMSSEIARGKRRGDATMCSLFNSRERGHHDWSQLFAEADPRFKLIAAKQPEVNKTGKGIEEILAIIEAAWIGE